MSIGIACTADLPGETPSQNLSGTHTAMDKVKQCDEHFPYLATRADAYADPVNGRRADRSGTALQGNRM
ncbi:hypothetical protein [Streptomyces carpinensis]|uniref:Uncharacterized protein n=1 Tax=Streptomyces carpinensis TaxID=66369 RepID=A0ABV1W2Q9_9ACTN|nr:hypothetical protein [Streptomyces carpinensis]